MLEHVSSETAADECMIEKYLLNKKHDDFWQGSQITEIMIGSLYIPPHLLINKA